MCVIWLFSSPGKSLGRGSEVLQASRVEDTRVARGESCFWPLSITGKRASKPGVFETAKVTVSHLNLTPDMLNLDAEAN